MRPKKVAIIYSGAKYWGGIETYLAQLFKYADNKEAALILISLGDWPLVKAIKMIGGDVRVVSGARVRLTTVRDISSIIRDEGVSLIASQGVVANFYARLASRCTKISSLVTVHSELRNDYPKFLSRFIYVLSDRLLRGYTSKYITVSKYLKEKLSQSGIKPSQIKVIYNALEDSLKGSNPFKKGSTLFKGKGVTIGSVGRLHKVKGYNNLIAAMGLLRDKEVNLVVWGEGEEKENIQNQIDELSLGSRVRLAGFAKDLGEALKETDIYVQSSISEGFGLAVLGAMMHEKPVIVTNAGALPEIVEDRKTGIILRENTPLAIADAIRELIDNPEFADKIGKNAAAHAKEKFNTKNWANETINTYLEASEKAEKGYHLFSGKDIK
ncbi:TPA: hypothetical protein DDW69_00885 [candidate division CPR2 bacterium]|uniref:Glycosyl transferase group 1 n=1 Tax=candidate division CPR2 bacterium GW2011_GWC1_41_48 TaxID=1618344 RepID=A0A0G0YJB9_UNCC2|nr:MAG: Glycosyl transferase group 1 [candidate division CPR2 bacterium GW2011_GWC2_39_35]KKR28737.1 MAG: Glycosyl transferase group 1 [candidate division CPR2 bacterium GW2011_GWD2_39_7]KKS09606.1 MAG: Glycosyl transferase group 1 [candidate division CPR2 bacterium GW2011_GWC1_41_48]OGB73128.1 MAG: hypothetical protein A2Y26_03055 [candidate division CPR2 bacterium GWD2_39_7]HBG81375.1 hypothetical protein [candidate division CPR2 bacterium]